ncbi:hypothetical protein ACJX0J_006859, partial [Zea mays]
TTAVDVPMEEGGANFKISSFFLFGKTYLKQFRKADIAVQNETTAGAWTNAGTYLHVGVEKFLVPDNQQQQKQPFSPKQVHDGLLLMIISTLLAEPPIIVYEKFTCHGSSSELPDDNITSGNIHAQIWQAYLNETIIAPHSCLEYQYIIKTRMNKLNRN